MRVGSVEGNPEWMRSKPLLSVGDKRLCFAVAAGSHRDVDVAREPRLRARGDGEAADHGPGNTQPIQISGDPV